MNRLSEERLLDFCARQKIEFDPGAWLNLHHPDRRELAATALFLAGVDWYGHRDELFQVAELIHSGSIGHLAALVKTTGFDCGRFSSMLKTRLRHGQSLS